MTRTARWIAVLCTLAFHAAQYTHGSHEGRSSFGRFEADQATSPPPLTESPVAVGESQAPGGPKEREGNCTPPAITQFPRPLMSARARRSGGLIVQVLVALYMFAGLALSCDDYFVPSLEVIALKLKLSSDVAGATFMAAGSSAPELATSIIGVMIVKDDMGLGTVVGSAIYNVLFVISVCGLFAGMVTYLSWWPLVRDCTFYLLSILVLLAVMKDELVYWYEALGLLLLYLGYILLMCYNERLERLALGMIPVCHDKARSTSSAKNLSPAQLANYEAVKMAPSPDESLSEVEDEDITEVSEDVCSQGANGSVAPGVDRANGLSAVGKGGSVGKTHEIGGSDTPRPHTHLEDSAVDSPFLSRPTGGACALAWWVTLLPLRTALYLTVPDCRLPRWSRWYMVTFIMSCVWTGAFSYVMVWQVAVLGYTVGIPDTVMSLTLIAFGASAPDVIASLLVARDGFGDMAVSNAVGSNIFDILLCLGFPWFLQTTVMQQGPVKVFSRGLTYSTVTLLSTVVFLLVAMHVNRWRLNRPLGVVLMVAYLGFMVLTSLYELNVFKGVPTLPECRLSNY